MLFQGCFLLDKCKICKNCTISYVNTWKTSLTRNPLSNITSAIASTLYKNRCKKITCKGDFPGTYTVTHCNYIFTRLMNRQIRPFGEVSLLPGCTVRLRQSLLSVTGGTDVLFYSVWQGFVADRHAKVLIFDMLWIQIWSNPHRCLKRPFLKHKN